MTLQERLKKAETGRQVLYKGSDGQTVYKGSSGGSAPKTEPAAESPLSLEERLDRASIGELPGIREANDTGYQNWLGEVDRFTGQAQKDSEARDGVWQESSTFEDYRRRQADSANKLLRQAAQYRDYFKSHQDDYDSTALDNALKALEQGSKYLTGVGDALSAEGEYRGQFLNQYEYDTYERLSKADAEELKRWNEELEQETRDLQHHKLGSREETKQALERIRQTQNRVLSRYYELDNQEKLAALEKDQTAKSLYTQADAGTFDADTLLRRMLDRLDRGGRPEEDPAAAERIAELYGIDPVSSGSIAQYMNDLTAALGTEPEGGDKQAEAIRALAGMGYDYNRLARYKKTQEDAKRFAEEQEQIRQTAQEHPALSSGLSVLAAPFQGLDYLDAAARALSPAGDPKDIERYEPLNVYNMGATNLVSGIRGAVAEQIEEQTPGMELFGHNVPSFLYQTGMSMADSAAQVGLLGPASLPIMGGAAAANQAQDIIARGGNNTQVLLGGAAAGAAEMLFEKFSVEQLLAPKSVTGWKSMLKETAKQAGTEASEEMFTEIANILSDAAIMGRDSTSELAVREYMLRGMSEEEARQQVFLDQIGQVAEAGVGGALSGAGMGGATSAMNWALGGGQYGSMEAMQYQNRTDPLVQAAREMVENPQSAPDGQSPVSRLAPGASPFQKGPEGQGTDGAAEGNPQSASQTAPFSRGPQSPAPSGGTAMEKAAEVFGENGRKAFAAAWDGEGDSARYYAGFAAWYQAGLEGKAESQVRSPYAGAVSEAQRLAAYNSGQRDGAVSLAKEKAASPFAKTAGTEAGLVYDEYVAEAVERNPQSASQTAPFSRGPQSPVTFGATPFQKGAEGQGSGTLTAETAGRINTVAKALGVRVRFVDSVDGGRANAQISGSEILVERNNPNPVMTIVGHELTHRVQELSPESYRAFREAAVAELADSAVQAKLDAYRAQGENILYEQAMDEAAADYAGRLMEETQVLDRFIERHRTDRTLLEKVRDAFRHLVDKLTGAERRRAQTAEGRLTAALDAAAEGADSLSQASPDSSLREGAEGQGADGETRYSLKEFTDGKRFVEVETDQARFDGLTYVEMEREARKVIKEKFKGKVIGIDNRAFVNGLTAKEYGHPQKRLDQSEHEAKMRASTELDNLMDAGTNFRTAPDGRDGHTHPEATGDFQYFDTIFKVGSEYYQGTINIMPIAKGLLLKDITQIKNITQDTHSSYGVNPQATFLRDVSMDSVPQSGGESNPQYSLKGTTITRTYDQLLRENDALRERLDYWRGQTRTTKEVTTDKKSVTAAAKALVQEYGAKLDAGALAERLQGLYDAMASGKDGQNELGPTDAWQRAEAIARDLADAAVEEWSLNTEFPGLKDKLRTTPITIGHEYDGDIRNENFRREYRGRLKLSSQGTTNVDTVYAELAESYPGLFPQDITHPADQLEQIMEVADSLSAVSAQNPFSGHMEEAVTGITNEIMEGFFDLPQTRATFADRQAEKLEGAVAHGKQRVAETREQYKARMDALRRENRQAVQNAIARERETRARQLQALKARYAQSRENAAGRRADSRARDRLLHIVRRLQNAKLPEVNRALLNEYIGDLDTVAKSMTGKTLEKLTNLRDWYAEQKSNNPDFIADPKIEKDLERLSKRQIGDLSAREVADLTQALLHIENEIRTQRRLIDSQERRDVYQAGEAAIRDIEASAGSKPSGLWSFVDRNIITETLSPLREVRRITGYAPDSPLTRVTQELADGQRTMFDYQRKAEAQFAKYTGDKGFTRSFAGPKAKGIQIQGLGKDGPVTVTITPAMRASLYLHSLNDQNLKHIRDGGITVPDWKLYQKGQLAEAYARGTTVKLTPSQVRSITANMTQQERAFALAAHRYFNVTSKEAVNSVSEKLKGYALAQVENYFPIRTDSSFTRADFESVKFDGTIEGMGFLKERVNAANPILLRDMSAELDQSIQMHSKYVGLAVPVRNFNKLWNVTTGSYSEDGTKASYTDSVKNAVKGKWGEAGYSYIEKMMSDLQNGHRPSNVWSKAMSKLRSNYAGAVLTLNASVAMKQAASYPTAAAVLGWGPLSRAMADVGKVDLDLIAKYTPLQWYRSKGFSTQELGDMATRNKQLPKVLNWVQGVDLITTRKLWKASEYYVQAHNKGLNRGTDAYYRAVADIYNQVIEETQPNYTTMQRPQLLRSDDSLLANLQMFKTQPFQNFNIVYDAAGELVASMRRGDKAQIKSAWAKAGRAVTSQLGQLAVFAGMTMVWAMLRGKKKKYEDEEGELTLQSALSALGKDMAGGALAGIPFGSDAWELLSSKFFGDSYYGMDAVTVQALSDTIQSLDGMGELIGATVRAASAGEDIDWRSAGIKLDGYLDDISKAAGVPYENVANLFQACYRQVCVHTLGELQGEYAAMKLTADPSKKSGEYYDLLYKALERGDLDSYFTIREELPELLGKDNSAIDSAMTSRYKAAVKKDPGYSLSERARDLLGIRPKLDDTKKEDAFSPDDLDSEAHQSFQEQRADRWRAAAAKLEGNALYGKLSDAEKDKALNAAWTYAQQTALAEASGGQYKPTAEWIGKAQEAAKRGVQPWEYVLYNTAYGTDAAYKALERGSLSEYKTLRGKYMDVLGKSGTSVDASMRGKYEDKLKENPRYTLPQAALDLIGIHPSGSSGEDSFDAGDLNRVAYDAYTAQRAADYRETVDSLEDMLSFRDMDQETRDKLVSMAYTMAHQTALADNSNGQYTPSSTWVRDALDAQEDAGIENGEFLLWKTAYNMAFSDKDANGKAIKGREKRDKVKAWLLEQEDLTPEQRAYLWGTEYKSAW